MSQISKSVPEKTIAGKPIAEKQVTLPTAPATKGSLQYQRDKDREKVRGIFRFHEVPGGTMSFCFKKYKGDPVERYDMIDGMTYSIPLGVAKHLNTNVWYPVHAYTLSEGGTQTMNVGRKVRRCSFQSLEFVDMDDLPMGKAIEEVTLPPLAY